MATIENLPNAETERPIGFGRLKRKEDARFIRGQGTYLDDIRLPGMVHGVLLRSPYAHARIVSIDTSRALAHPNVLAEADVVVTRDIIYPRCHPAPLETCGIIADFNPETGHLDIYNGNQAPHAHRTVYAHVAGLAEHMIRIRTQDIGGGFGNKVPVYPGYVCAIAGSIVAGVPVKWVEDRSENLLSTGFARDYVMHAEMCAKDGKITGLRVDVIADHGAFDSTAQPTKFPAGFFHIVCGSYDLRAAHVKVKAVYTNKAPGGVAYRCSFRITAAVYLVERMVKALAMAMDEGADVRVHPSGKAVVSLSAQTQGQGHETTFAQIVAEELGIPPEGVQVRHGDTDKSPYGLGTYGSRSTPVSGGAVAVVSRKVRDKARLIAATMLEARPEDLAWEKGRWYVKGDPEKGALIEEIAQRAYSGEPLPT